MKIGVNFKLDVTKLDKARFFKGAKGTYVDLTAFIDTEKTGDYGDNGTIRQSTTKEERDGGMKLPICGNVKVFYVSKDADGYQPDPGAPAPTTPDDIDDDIPF